MPSILFLFFISIHLSAQTEIDSINLLIKKGGHDTLLFNYHMDAAQILWSNEPKKSRNYLDEALVIADQLKDERRQAEVYHMYAITYYFESNVEKSLELNKKALAIRKKIKDKRGMCRSYGNMGLLYEIKGDFSTSLWYHNASLHIEEELKNKKGIAQSLGNIGNLYMGLADYDKALKCQFKALKIIKTLNDDHELATALGNISIIYENLNKLDLALDYARKGLKLRIKLGDIQGQALAHSNLVLYFIKRKEYDSARVNSAKSRILYENAGNREGLARAHEITGDVLYVIDSLKRSEQEYSFAYKLYQEVGDPNGMATSSIGLANVADKKKEYNKSIQYCLSALSMLEGKGYLDAQVKALNQLHRSYAKAGDYKKALGAQARYYILNDSLTHNKGLLNIEKQELQMGFEQRTMRDSLATMKQKAIDDARFAESESSRKQQRTVLVALIIGIVIVVGFLAFVFNRLRLIRRQKKEIEREKKIREEQHLLLEERNTEIVDSINYAWRIQHGMLPTPEKVAELFPESFVMYLPKDKLSGDFYWVGKVRAENLGELKIFSVADCTGHGIPGALVSITGINYLKLGESHAAVNSPAQALDFINKGFYDLFQENTGLTIRDGMDLAFAALQTNTLTLHYATAKNPIIVIRNNALVELKGDKHPIGRFGPEEPIPFTDHSYPLQKGDVLYVYSDGYSDQFGGLNGATQTRKFKSGELKKLLVQINNKPMAEQREILFMRLQEWKGMNEQTDDITIIGIRV